MEKNTQKDEIGAFAADLDNLIERTRRDCNITFAAMIGALHIKTDLLCRDLEKLMEEARTAREKELQEEAPDKK